MFEKSELDEIRRNMIQCCFDKDYGLICAIPDNCIKCAYYKHCRDLRQIFKNREYKLCDNHNIKESNND